MTHTASSAAWEAALAAAGLPLQETAGEAPPVSTRAPWPIRLLAGVGGFIGGVMILLFFGAGLAALNLFKTAESAVFIGLVLCACAVAAYRMGKGSVAAEQCALAVSVAGQIALAIGVVQAFKGSLVPQWWALVAVQAVMVLLVANGLHRTLLAASMVMLGSLSCTHTTAVAWWWGAVALAVALLVKFEGRLVARGRLELVAPVAFGALAGLIIMHWPWWFAIWGSMSGPTGFPWHWSATLPALLAAATLASAGATAGQRVAVVALALTAGVLGVWLPGWTASLLLALLGLAWARPGWAVVAALAMIFSISRFYYSMRITLLEKAAWMAAAGLACLLLAALVHWIAPRLAAGGVDEAEGT